MRISRLSTLPALLVALVAVLIGGTGVAAAYPAGVVGTASINGTQFNPGQTVIVTVQNTTPGRLVMQIFSAPVTIGVGTVGANGSGSVAGAVPAGYSGAHTIQVTGAGGEVYPFAITVGPPRSAPNPPGGVGTPGRGGTVIGTGPPTVFLLDEHTLVVWDVCDAGRPDQPYDVTVSGEGGWKATKKIVATGSGDAVGSGVYVDPDHSIPVGTSTVYVTEAGAEGSFCSGGTDVTRVDQRAGSFVSLPPARVLDTREGNGAPRARVSGGGTVALPLAGRGGVPTTGASAVVLNVTVAGPSGSGYVTAYPNTASRPLASNLNYVAGQVVPNLVVVPLGTDGKVALYNGGTSTVDLVADVAGYYLGGTPSVPGAFTPLVPSRLLDTREGTASQPARKVAGGTATAVTVNGTGGVPSTGVSAVVLNVTAVGGAAPGFVTAYPNTGSRPLASNLNYVAGQVVPNLVVVPVGTDGKVALYNGGGGPVDLVVDVAGWYRAGSTAVAGSFRPVNPSRLLDTREGLGGPKRPVTSGTGTTVAVTGVAGVPATDVAAVVLTVTVTNPTGSGFVTAYPDGTTRPLASNLNYVTGLTVPNTVVVPVGSNGRVALFNGPAGGGTVDLVVDVAGYVRQAGDGAPVITSTSLPNATLGTLYSAPLSTADGRPGTWSNIIDSAIPLDVTGSRLSGTPGRVPGEYPVGLVFVDEAGRGTYDTASLTVTAVRSPSGASAVAVGGTHSCALLVTRLVACWGGDRHASLGPAGTGPSPTPVTVTGLSGVTALSAGGDTTCAVVGSSGAVRCWGAGGAGQLGNGRTVDSRQPVAVTNLSGVVSVSVGPASACAVLTSGGVSCWGAAIGGQGAATSTPAVVSGVQGAAEVAVGDTSACARLTSGAVRCWGANTFGQLGDGTTTDAATPTTVSGLADARSITVGRATACAIRTSGAALVCWGADDFGQFHDNGSFQNSTTPSTSFAVGNTASATVGGISTCVVGVFGGTGCTGANVGDGSPVANWYGQPATTGLLYATSLDADYDVVGGSLALHTCAATATGEVWCWGDNEAGELGDGTTTDATRPVRVTGIG